MTDLATDYVRNASEQMRRRMIEMFAECGIPEEEAQKIIREAISRIRINGEPWDSKSEMAGQS